MNLFGILEIERKTDILALSAFIISIFSVLYQVKIYFESPWAQVVKPQYVTFMKFEPGNGSAYASVVSPISILNNSNAKRSLLVKEMYVTTRLKNTDVKWEWHRRIPQIVSTTNGIEFMDAVTVKPFSLPAGKMNADFYLFTPHNWPCIGSSSVDECNIRDGFVSLDQLKSIIVDRLRTDDIELTFNYSFKLSTKQELKTHCSISISGNWWIKLRKHGYVTQRCND